MRRQWQQIGSCNVFRRHRGWVGVGIVSLRRSTCHGPLRWRYNIQTNLFDLVLEWPQWQWQSLCISCYPFIHWSRQTLRFFNQYHRRLVHRVQGSMTRTTHGEYLTTPNVARRKRPPIEVSGISRHGKMFWEDDGAPSAPWKSHRDNCENSNQHEGWVSTIYSSSRFSRNFRQDHIHHTSQPCSKGDEFGWLRYYLGEVNLNW